MPDALPGKSLDYKCLALTGSFETGAAIPECFCGLTGDFDSQGLSLGALQWNFGQDTLQPLLKDMISQHAEVMKAIFNEHVQSLATALNADKPTLMRFARSTQHPVKHTISEPWRGMFKALGRSEELQALQLKHANACFQAAKKLAAGYGLWSERAAALMFDIKAQNGDIGKAAKARILSDFAGLNAGLSEERAEVRRMEIIANRRAEAAKPAWIEDVRARKLCIARGKGVVHGIHYNLEEQFGIRLKPFAD